MARIQVIIVKILINEGALPVASIEWEKGDANTHLSYHDSDHNF
jgi:hypothetical protein